jgi:hypothetical protein
LFEAHGELQRGTAASAAYVDAAPRAQDFVVAWNEAVETEDGAKLPDARRPAGELDRLLQDHVDDRSFASTYEAWDDIRRQIGLDANETPPDPA